MRFSLYEWHQVRMKLLDYLHGKNIKVSLFLNANLQNRPDGSFVIEVNDYVMGCDVPGTVRTYKTDGSLASSMTLETHPFSSYESTSINHFDTRSRTSNYGYNLYMDQKKFEDYKQFLTDAKSSAPTTTNVSSVMDSKQQELVEKRREAETKDLNYLAKLIGVSADSTSKSTFKIENLFPESRIAQSEDGGKPETYVLRFDAPSAQNSTLQSVLNDFSIEEGSSSVNDDLLSLMDNA